MYNKVLKMNSISNLAAKYNSDKQFKNHNYVGMYEQWIGNLHVNKILEIGLGGGASVRMWADYFPDAEVYTMELGQEEFQKNWANSTMDVSDIKIIVGNSTEPKSWGNVPDNLSVIIDDGDHTPDSQIATFKLGFPKLRSRGLYFIEDTHCGFEESYGTSFALYEYFFNLVSNQQLPGAGTEGDFYKFNQFMPDYVRDIFAYHFYKSVILLEKA